MIIYENQDGSVRQVSTLSVLNKQKGLYTYLPVPVQEFIKFYGHALSSDHFVYVFSSDTECDFAIGFDEIEEWEDYFLKHNIHEIVDKWEHPKSASKGEDDSSDSDKNDNGKETSNLMLFHYTNDNGVLYSKCYISGYDNKKFHDEIDQITHDDDLAHFQDMYVMPKYHFAEHYQRSKKLHKAIMNMNAEVFSALFNVQKESRKLGYDFVAGYGDYAPVEIAIMKSVSIRQQHQFSKQKSDDSFIDEPLCFLCWQQDYNGLQFHVEKPDNLNDKEPLLQSIQTLQQVCDKTDARTNEFLAALSHDDDWVELDSFLSQDAPKVHKALDELEKYCKKHNMVAMLAGGKYATLELLIDENRPYWNSHNPNIYDEYNQEPLAYVCVDLNNWNKYYGSDGIINPKDFKLKFQLIENHPLSKELLDKITDIKQAVDDFNNQN